MELPKSRDNKANRKVRYEKMLFKLFKQEKGLNEENTNERKKLCPKFGFYLKDGEWDRIKAVKGWECDADAARALGVSRYLVSRVVNGKAPVSSQMMGMLAYKLGNMDVNWWKHFELVIDGWYQQDHQKFNQMKYKGDMPYAYLSESAELRGKNKKHHRRPLGE